MPNRSSAVVCSGCGHHSARWLGQCPACHGWGTFQDVEAAPSPAADGVRARPIGEVPRAAARRWSTGIGELDRVLGGGIVPGSVAVVSGEPGIGKSTLMLQVAAQAAGDRTVLYVTGEETAAQVRLRADRLGLGGPRLLLVATSDLSSALAQVAEHEPALVVVDSIQTLSDPAAGAGPGSLTQVRACADGLALAARSRGLAVVMVGHVTKEGTLAGPRALEHLVDVVLSFDGDHHHALRLLRATKNRFGSTGEIGCFTMRDVGLVEVTDPSRLFLGDRPDGVAGSAVTVTMEGQRPLAVEVQALVAASPLQLPRRQVSGLDPHRVQLLAAVLERRAEVQLSRRDLFASAVGGVRLREPAADLACCLAIGSSEADRPLQSRLVAVGEVGLSGEVRVVPQLARRLAEAARLGSRGAVVAASYDGPDHGLELHRVADVRSALRVALVRRIRAA